MKKIYILPNLFTTANMFCGFFSIVAAIEGNFITAAWAILVGMIFDSMDGRVARMTRATSAFGLEYDSFSDLISFGMAPALMTYLWCLTPYQRLGWLAAFLYLVCAALRLSRFNVNTNVIPKKYFQGMPSPLAAATIATALIFYEAMRPAVPKSALMLILLLVSASLMISNVRFPSFKEFKVKRENSFSILALGILLLVLVAARPEIMLFMICVMYTAVGIALDFSRVAFGKKRLAAEDEIQSKQIL